MTKKVITTGMTVLLSAICFSSIASAQTNWQRTYGGQGDDVGNSVQQTSDGGCIITGYTNSLGAGGYDVYLIKTNSSGDTLWTRTYGGPGHNGGNSVQQTTDGGYIITGYTSSFGAGEFDVYLIKTNARGDTLWTRTYGGQFDDEGYSVRQTTDGGYIITGYTSSFGAGGADVYVIKTNAQGDTLWTRTWGMAEQDEGQCVRQTTDGGYIIAGITESFGVEYQEVYLIKTDAQGDTLWTRTFAGIGFAGGYSVQQTADGGYVIGGYTASIGAGYDDVYLIKTDANGYAASIEEPLPRHPASPTRFLVQPNPFTSSARVPGHETELFALTDITGRQVAVCKGDRVGEGLRPGVYFLSPVGHKTGKAVTTTIVKTAF